MLQNHYKVGRVLRMSLWVMMLNFLMSCQPNKMTTKELLHWFNQPENGYVKTKKVGGMKFTLRYQPDDYLRLIHTEHEDNTSQTNFVLTIETTEEKKFVGIKAKYPKMNLYDQLQLSLASQEKKYTSTIQYQERGMDESKRVINTTFDKIDTTFPFTVTINALESGGQLIHFTFENINHTIPELSIKEK